MNRTTKIYLLGVVACLIGAALIDCNIYATGTTLLTIGTMTLAVGPLVAGLIELEDRK